MSAWLNEYEIDEASRLFANDPVLGPAAKTLARYRDMINAHSDGWPYWRAGTAPAADLCDILYKARLRIYGAGFDQLKSATQEDVAKAVRRIRSFVTKRRETFAGETL